MVSIVDPQERTHAWPTRSIDGNQIIKHDGLSSYAQKIDFSGEIHDTSTTSQPQMSSDSWFLSFHDYALEETAGAQSTQMPVLCGSERIMSPRFAIFYCKGKATKTIGCLDANL